MQRKKIDLITVSREFGAGGSDFAAELGSRLGWQVLDQDLIRRIAERLHPQVAAVLRLDEHPAGWLARVSSALLIAQAAQRVIVGRITIDEATTLVEAMVR